MTILRDGASVGTAPPRDVTPGRIGPIVTSEADANILATFGGEVLSMMILKAVPNLT
jgi:hypothetical protein